MSPAEWFGWAFGQHLAHARKEGKQLGNSDQSARVGTVQERRGIMAHIRTYQQLLALEPTDPEEQLLECATAGEHCIFNDGHLPEPEQYGACEIRPEFLRYLILGGCDECPVDTRGIWLEGAYISGGLDLNYVSTSAVLSLFACKFQSPLYLQQSKFHLLVLSDSAFSGLHAQGIAVQDSVLMNGAQITGSVDIAGATIGGQLSLVGAKISTQSRFAISAHSADIRGGIFLHPRTEEEQDKVTAPFSATGEIYLVSAKLGGLFAENTKLTGLANSKSLTARNMSVNGDVKLGGCIATGEVKLAGSQIAGDLSCAGATFQNANGHAFNGQRMRVDQSFIWKKVDNPQGKVSLNGAHVGELDDDPANWPDAGNLHLDGFTYDRIRGKVSTSPARKEWLLNGSLYKDQFFPQPYTQYAKFLRDTGHDAQSRKVLLTRERMVRRYERKEFGPLLRAWRYFWDGLQLVVVGHGHAPFWSLGWLALLIVLATIPAHKTWEEGSFAPNSSPVLISQGWQRLQASAPNPAQVWSGDTEPAGWSPAPRDPSWSMTAPGRDWETFNRYAYAADIVIPLINFGQTEAWAPSTARGQWGWHLWWLRWVFTVFGWIVTALGAAAITGIIRRE